MQLKPAKSKIHKVLNRTFLLVERYDRLVDAQGHRQRIHQEDFCQALGVVPEMKYQNEGGVPNTDAEDGDENRQQIQVQRRSGASLGAVC